MQFSRFFIDRPIFAAVLSIAIFLAGAVADVLRLPVSEYPEVVPPSIVVRAVYPGANPRVLAESVATPLEEQINGVEDMLYMSSQATSRRRAQPDRDLPGRNRRSIWRRCTCRTGSTRRCPACPRRCGNWASPR